MGMDIEKKKILLDEPIKRLGNYTVPIKVFHDEKAEIKLEVNKEGVAYKGRRNRREKRRTACRRQKSPSQNQSRQLRFRNLSLRWNLRKKNSADGSDRRDSGR